MMDANVVVDLPDCLIVEIFSRLPVKSLCRFKCVSKFCLSFLQDPSFVDTIRPKTPILLQIQSLEDECLYVYSIDCNNGVSTMKHKYELRGHFEFFTKFSVRYCNGLNSYFYSRNCNLRVCNVATKEDITLPKWCGDCALCYDSSTDKYKVLGWVEDKSEDVSLDFRILTLERDPSWRPVMNSLKKEYLNEPDVTINGEPFWLDIYGDERQILSFNPTIEEFRTISLPDEANVDTFWYCIFDFEQSLCLVEQPQSRGPTFNLWIFNGNAWVMMKRITLPFEGTGLDEYYATSLEEHETVLAIDPWIVESFNFSFRGGELLVTEVADYECKFIFMYNFLNNQFRRINITELPFGNFTGRNYYENGFTMRNYVENCYSLQGLV